MEQKRKPKSPWLVFIWLIWSLIAPGCAQFPGHSYADCVTNYSDTPALAKACKEEIEQRTLRDLRRKEKAAEKAGCVMPYGIWVEPPGMCASATTTTIL